MRTLAEQPKTRKDVTDRRRLVYLREAKEVADRFGVPLLELPGALKKNFGPGLANAFEQYCTYDTRSAANRFIASANGSNK